MKHSSLRRAFTARPLLAVAALFLAAPAVASADVPIASFKAGPVAAYNHPTGLPLTTQPSVDAGCNYGTPGAPIDTSAPDAPLALATQAGANTDFCVAFRLSPGDALTGTDVNNTVVTLPVGSLGEIDNASKCSVEAFARDSSSGAACPTSSQVGTALAQLQIALGATARQTQDSPGRIYALSTPSDKAALLGVALIASSPSAASPTTPYTETKFIVTVTQQGSPTVGLVNATDTLARSVTTPLGTAPIAILANALRFWGKAADHPHLGAPATTPPLTTPAANFFRVGTTCTTPQVTTLTVNPWTGPNPTTGATPATSNPSTATSAPYLLTGCEALPFNPTFTAAITGETQAGGHPGLAVHIASPEGDADLGATTIALPIGVATDLSRIQNSCPKATFDAGACTAATVIGSVKATLSGINADVVSGDVQMVKIDGKTLPALGLDFHGRLPLRISGTNDIDSSGRIVSTFANLPSIPERTLDITLNGGATGILQVSTARCVASAYTATLTGQNGKTKAFSLPTTCPAQFTATLYKADTRTPYIRISGTGATGKKLQTVRTTFPSGVTVNKNHSKSGIKITRLDAALKGDTTRARLSSKELRFTLPRGGSNAISILTRTKTLAASSKYTKRSAGGNVTVRIVYTDGTKVDVPVAITRKDS